MAETTVVADAVPPVAMPDADAAPSARPAASPARRRRLRIAAKRSLGGNFPSAVALPVVSGLLGVVFGYALGRRRDEKPGEAEEGAPAEPDPPRPLALTPPTSPGPNLASPARAKAAPRERRVFGALDANAEMGRYPTTTPTPDAKNGWTLTDFQAFAELKIGKPGGPAVRWSVEGELFEYPTGRLLARVAGVDVCRRVVDDDATSAERSEREDGPPSKTRATKNAQSSSRISRPDAKTISISRKLLLFLDPETNEVMTEFEGRAVEPAAFPYRVVEYAFSSNENENETRAGDPDDGPSGPGATRRGSVTATVTVGAGASKMTLTGASVAVSRGRRFANDRVFSVPAFLDVETRDGGRHEAYESYDYFQTGSRDPPSPPPSRVPSKREEDHGDSKTWTFAWTRFGACAPFGEACVLRALARRVPSHEALPEAVRRFAETHAPEYADAPRDLAEIRKLQA